jgi:hypothetical protein
MTIFVSMYQPTLVPKKQTERRFQKHKCFDTMAQMIR